MGKHCCLTVRDATAIWPVMYRNVAYEVMSRQKAVFLHTKSILLMYDIESKDKIHEERWQNTA